MLGLASFHNNPLSQSTLPTKKMRKQAQEHSKNESFSAPCSAREHCSNAHPPTPLILEFRARRIFEEI